MDRLEGFKTKHSLFPYFISCVLMILLWVVDAYRTPECAQAGTCYDIADLGIKAAIGDNSNSGSWLWDDGGCATLNYTSPALGELAGKSKAMVMLRGFAFNFTDDDHQIDNIKVNNQNNIVFNSATGQTSWTMEACQNDGNDDDDFEWLVWYTIISYND